MALTQFADIYPGEELQFVVSQSPPVDISAIPITVVMDAPDGSQRFVMRYLNGGSDGVLSNDHTSVTFSQTSAWTAANLTPGLWSVYFLCGIDSTTQSEIGSGIKKVIRPGYGPFPVTH